MKLSKTIKSCKQKFSKLSHNISKTHIQIFTLSFAVCLVSFFALSRKSESNIPPDNGDMTETISSMTKPRISGDNPLSDATNSSNNDMQNILAPQNINSLVSGMMEATNEYMVEVKNGDSLASILSRIGVCYSDILEVSKTINPICKLSDLRPNNDKVIVKVKPVASNDDKNSTKMELEYLEIVKSPIFRVVSQKTTSGFETKAEQSNITTQLVRSEGSIAKGASLIEIALNENVPYNVIDKFYDIFSFDVDFERDIYPGDKFQIMYEQQFSDSGEYIGNGDVIYASLYLNSRHQEFKLYRYETASGEVGYYDENGRGASKTLKKTPINSARISSKFGKRKHPILGYSRAHKGVDFAAPTGTPIPAAGSGKVVARGWVNGYGNYIKIRHNGTYSTAYGHMSRYQPNVVVGTHVKQGQIIGYVGSTGWSTGPHLHYEIIKDGVQVNPLTVKLPSIKSLTDTELAKFTSNKDKVNVQFAVLAPNFTTVAMNLDALTETISNIDTEK